MYRITIYSHPEGALLERSEQEEAPDIEAPTGATMAGYTSNTLRKRKRMPEIVNKLSELDWLQDVVKEAEDGFEYAVEETGQEGTARLLTFMQWGTLEDKRDTIKKFRERAQYEADYADGIPRLTYKIVRRPKPEPYEVVEGE